MPSASAVRAYNLSLVRALAEHLQTNPDADVLEGLLAVVLQVQGAREELDDGQVEVIRALSGSVVDNYARFAARA